MTAADAHGPVLVALGTSLGDRRRLLVEAVAALDRAPGVQVRAASRIYDTAPVGGVAVQRFLNAAVAVETSLEPEALLDRLQAVETALGRARDRRWEDRTMDLDLLLWGTCVIDTGRLTVPHPQLHLRRFALAPAVDLAPHCVHPVLGRSLAALLASLPAGGDDDCIPVGPHRLLEDAGRLSTTRGLEYK